MMKSNTRKILKDFCESTSLHGYSYLYLSESIFLKFLWFLVILIATGFGIGFLVSNAKSYFEATIVTNIESASANLTVSIKSIRYFVVNFKISFFPKWKVTSTR